MFFSRIDGGNIGTFTNLIKKKVKVAALNIKWHHVNTSRDSQKHQMQLEKREKVGNLGKL